ncbi:MAG: SPOR domain-containing protein [bacterium]|nr:hypothetical protein [Gammaproteobacteria bacterium]HIL99356.1 hypothetical protein [Pseudomonadales bacterium]
MNLEKQSALTNECSKLSIALLFFVGSLSFPVNADFGDGINAFRNSEYETAIREWQPYAEQNDPRALYNLGQIYRRGLGVEPDLAVAEQYYRRAAELGHPHAQGNLGSIYYSRSPVDMDQVLYYWQKAAEGGDIQSQYLLGIQYSQGKHIKQDHLFAYAWVKLAIDSGLENAKYALDVLSLSLSENDIKRGDELARQFSEETRTGMQRQSPERVAHSGAPDSRSTPDPLTDVFRIQIASLSSMKQARFYLERESKQMLGVLEDATYYIAEADLGERGIFYRLQLGNFTKREKASSFCDQLKKTGLDCYVVSSLGI